MAAGPWRNAGALGAAVLAFAAPRLPAQATAPAVVSVRVHDAAGSAIAGADIALLDDRHQNALMVASTDAAGAHTFAFVPDSAHYRVAVRKVGYLATTRRLLVRPGDTLSVELQLAALAAVQRLPTVVTRETFRLDLDPGMREGFDQRCSARYVSCVRDSTFAAYPSGDLLSFLNHADGIIPQPDNGFAPPPPVMDGTLGGRCEPAYYVNGFRWGLGWKELAQAYRGFALQGMEIYRAGEPRPGRFSGDPTCGVIVFWLKP